VAILSQSAVSADDLAHRAARIAQLEQLTGSWDEHHANTLTAIKTAIEELNCEGFRRLIRFLRADPACAARLNEAVREPFIFGLLRFHGLVKDPLEHRLEMALEEVRPFLREHGGDVELVALLPPDTAEIRLTGACHGCASSGQTLTEGVEKSIRAHCPEISTIRQVSRPGYRPETDNVQVVKFISPFARSADPGRDEVSK
jgi:Fe-S cluster biogenesis protein NfuA